MLQDPILHPLSHFLSPYGYASLFKNHGMNVSQRSGHVGSGTMHMNYLQLASVHVH